MIIQVEDLLIKSKERSPIGVEIKLLYSHIHLLNKYWGNSEPYNSVRYNERIKSQITIIRGLLFSILPQYKYIIEKEYTPLLEYTATKADYEQFLEHAMDLLEISLAGQKEIDEGNVFLGIEEKLKRANTSIRDGNKEGLFSNLHTVIEVFMKDKLAIALDMDGARLGKVLAICMQNEVFLGKNSLLDRLNKNVCEIDNKIKHTAYNPGAKECNDALLVVTQAIRILKDEMPTFNDEIKERISAILIKNN